MTHSESREEHVGRRRRLRRCVLLFAAAIVCCTWPSVAPAEPSDAECDSLLVTRAFVRQHPREYRQDLTRVRIRGRFTPTPDVRKLRPALGAIELRFGDDLLVYEDPIWETTRIERRDSKLRFFSRPQFGDRSRRRLVVDVKRGRFRAWIRREDLESLPSDGTVGIQIALRLGARTYHQKVPFDAGRRTWRYRAPRRRTTPPAPEPIADGDGVALPFRRLTDTEDSRPATAPRVYRVRNQDDLAAEWTWHVTEQYLIYQPVPIVDFDTKTVIFVDVGGRSTTGQSLFVDAVRTTPCGVHVVFREGPPGGATAEGYAWTAIEIPNVAIELITWSHTLE